MFLWFLLNHHLYFVIVDYITQNVLTWSNFPLLPKYLLLFSLKLEM